MKTVNEKVYDEDYYLSVCLGSEEFKTSKGGKLHPNVTKLLSRLSLTRNMQVLDIGSGRGDITLYLAQVAKKVVGIDYATSAINLANKTKKISPQKIQRKVSFHQMDATNLRFPANSFDCVICIDIFEHLSDKDLNKMLNQIKRILKSGGTLLFHTNTNKILLDVTYKYYIWPMNQIITFIDQQIKGHSYASLPKDPRTSYEKEQHINEPTYFYLKTLLKKHNLVGPIDTEVGFVKHGGSLRTKLYNAAVTLSPLSNTFPFNIFFAWTFIGKVKNHK